ncbi:hypothetical protein [Kibdelosporangium phytohabitans]|uniref:Uncharacterized protein n=1 Tax=Kibdelosporangium phytohabitans TaxID=860235 RepID=A0A0N9I2N8_9PSEU|nr:hypothetical protein [Kibdelosporangium phytohabitans]ALG08736.1 hypothetical protein AOZ06_19050 [Kibdelosporangium phytohabitans]MBE1470149.1 putative membrane protein [Kibdelosporangium phytohabitans]
MNKDTLRKLAADKAQEAVRGGKVNTKALVALVVVALVVLVGFLAYRLILVELITTISDHRGK